MIKNIKKFSKLGLANFMKKKIAFNSENNEDIPQVLNIFFPGKCNLQCKYCFVYKEEKYFNAIDRTAINKAVDIFLAYPGRKKTLSFNGGEPLLEWELIKKIHAYAKEQAKKRGIFLEVSIVTNGTLLKQSHVDFFIKHRVSARISIDGDRETHDKHRPFKEGNGRSSFDVVMKNIQELKGGQFQFSVAMVFGPATVGNLLCNIKFFQQKGFRQIDFYPEIYATWDERKITELRNEADKIAKYYISLFSTQDNVGFKISMLDAILNGLNVGKQEFCGKIQVDTQGNFFACDKIFSLPREKRGKCAIGDVGIGVNNEKRQEILNVLRKEFFCRTTLGCEHCKLKKYCFCPVGQYLYMKDDIAANPLFWQSFCAVSKILINMNLNIIKKLEYNESFVMLNRF